MRALPVSRVSRCLDPWAVVGFFCLSDCRSSRWMREVFCIRRRNVRRIWLGFSHSSFGFVLCRCAMPLCTGSREPSNHRCLFSTVRGCLGLAGCGFVPSCRGHCSLRNPSARRMRQPAISLHRVRPLCGAASSDFYSLRCLRHYFLDRFSSRACHRSCECRRHGSRGSLRHLPGTEVVWRWARRPDLSVPMCWRRRPGRSLSCNDPGRTTGTWSHDAFRALRSLWRSIQANPYVWSSRVVDCVRGLCG